MNTQNLIINFFKSYLHYLQNSAELFMVLIQNFRTSFNYLQQPLLTGSSIGLLFVLAIDLPETNALISLQLLMVILALAWFIITLPRGVLSQSLHFFPSFNLALFTFGLIFSGISIWSDIISGFSLGIFISFVVAMLDKKQIPWWPLLLATFQILYWPSVLLWNWPMPIFDLVMVFLITLWLTSVNRLPHSSKIKTLLASLQGQWILQRLALGFSPKRQEIVEGWKFFCELKCNGSLFNSFFRISCQAFKTHDAIDTILQNTIQELNSQNQEIQALVLEKFCNFPFETDEYLNIYIRSTLSTTIQATNNPPTSVQELIISPEWIEKINNYHDQVKHLFLENKYNSPFIAFFEKLQKEAELDFCQLLSLIQLLRKNRYYFEAATVVESVLRAKLPNQFLAILRRELILCEYHLILVSKWSQRAEINIHSSLSLSESTTSGGIKIINSTQLSGFQEGLRLSLFVHADDFIDRFELNPKDKLSLPIKATSFNIIALPKPVQMRPIRMSFFRTNKLSHEMSVELIPPSPPIY